MNPALTLILQVYVRLRPPDGGAAEASKQFVSDEGDDGKVTIKVRIAMCRTLAAGPQPILVLYYHNFG